MGNEMLKVTTQPCVECRTSSVIEVDSVGWYNYTQRGMYVQEAFPHMDVVKRELLITGTHPECWDKIFSEEEE